MVVRYFGGTKLGVSGLINAYRTAAAEAIRDNEIVERLILSHVAIQFGYPLMSQVMNLVRNHDLTVTSQELELDCKMTLGIRLSLAETVEKILSEIQGIDILK